MKDKLKQMGILVAEIVSDFVSTWTFVFLYTAAMFTWIYLHMKGYLNIDSEDFIKWNLFLSYFAGTQASIVLMSSRRQSYLDQKTQKRQFNVDKKTLSITETNKGKIEALSNQIDMLEELISDFIQEEQEKK